MQAIETIDPTHPTAAMGLKELVRQFQVEQKGLELSAETVRTYVTPLHHFVEWMAERGITTTDQLTRELVAGWQEDLKIHARRLAWRAASTPPEQAPYLRPATRSIYSTAIKQLVRYAASLELVDVRLTLAVQRVKVHRGLPRPIPDEDLGRIAAYLERASERRKLTGLRNRAMFWTLVSTSARISEALQMTRQDAARMVGKASGTTTVRRKGGAEGLLSCPPTVVAMISDYLDVRRDRSPWLWVGHGEGAWGHLSTEPPVRLTAAATNEAWRRIAKRARVQPFTNHQCRHTYATQELAAGTPHMAIAEAMGHRDLRAITTYAKVDEAHRQAGVNVMDNLIKRHRPKAPKLWPAPAAEATPVQRKESEVALPARRRAGGLLAGLRLAALPSQLAEDPLSDDEPWSRIAGAM